MFKKTSLALIVVMGLSIFQGAAYGLDDKENSTPQVGDKLRIEEKEEVKEEFNEENKEEERITEENKEDERITEDSTTMDHHDEEVEYDVIFKSLWSKKTHPNKFPRDAAFSTFVGIVHNNKGCLWKEGMMASDGLAKLAETGKNGRLEKNISKMKKKGGIEEKFFIKGGKVSSKERKTEIEVSKEYPMVSMAAKLLPSSDWFTGIDSVCLLEGGKWVDKKIVMVYAYDAGTMEGKMYTDKGKETKPQDKIMRIEADPFMCDGELIPVGCIMFVKDAD